MAGPEYVSQLTRVDQVVTQVPAPRAVVEVLQGPVQNLASWTRGYLRGGLVADGICALVGGLLAFQVRFDARVTEAWAYLLLSLALPPLWLVSVWLAGGYDSRFIGVGSDEFRRVLNVGVCLSWDGSVRLDLRCVENWSLMLDLQILWKTLSAVLGSSGAY